MYSILLVDDEPLILSGIKSLLNWENHDCKIVATARNGNEALEKIRTYQPNIVFCDINMPSISGISLLQIISEENPSIVFIMLTNLQDFDLVKSALQYRALDYIIKNQLDSSILENSLEKAKKEWKNRNQLAVIHSVSTQNAMLKDDFIRNIFFSPIPSTLPENYPSELNFNCYCAAYLVLNYNTDSIENQMQLYAWEVELIEAIAGKHFSNFSLIPIDASCQSLFFICENIPELSTQREDLFRQFYSKLCNSSQKITNVSMHMMVTDCFYGVQTIYDCRKELETLLDIYYNSENPLILFDFAEANNIHSLKLTGFSSQLVSAIHEKNQARCTILIDRITKRVLEVFHPRNQAIGLCNEIYSASCETLKTFITDFQTDFWLFQTETVLNRISGLHTRSQVADWLSRLKAAICALLTQFTQDRNHFIELVKDYVETHLEEHISLADAANHVNISPAYLSTLFQKNCNESFINYVNRRKIDYACKLIGENKYLIYEISYRLGFNNAYYFTKIFKRYIGMTPVEYQNSLKNS